MKSTDTLNPFVFIALIIADGLVGKTVQAFQPQNHVRQKTMKSSTSHTTTRLQAFGLVEGSTAVDAFFHSQPYLASLLTCMVPSRRRQPTCWHNRNKTTSTRTLMPAASNHLTLMYSATWPLSYTAACIKGLCKPLFTRKMYPTLFGSEPTVTSVVCQASIDNFVLAPFFCLPAFYSIKAVLAGQDVADGIQKYNCHALCSKVSCKNIGPYGFPFNVSIVPSCRRIYVSDSVLLCPSLGFV